MQVCKVEIDRLHVKEDEEEGKEVRTDNRGNASGLRPGTCSTFASTCVSCNAERGEEGHVWCGLQLEVWRALLHIGKGGRVYCRVLGGGRPNNPLSQIDCTETLQYKEKKQLKSQRSVKDGFDRKIRGK